MLLLRQEDTRGLITMAEAVAAVREAFAEWGDDPGLNAPRRRIHVPSGVRVSVHQGAVPGLGGTGLLTHCEHVKFDGTTQVYSRRNPPMLILNSVENGETMAMIFGEITSKELPFNECIMGLRTAATSLVGIDLAARADATRVGIVGGGKQAKNHLVGLAAIRPLSSVRVYRRNSEACRAFCAEMTPIIGVECVPVTRAEEAVRGVDIVLTATNSVEPVFDGSWLDEGTHVCSIVGSNKELVRGGFLKEKRRETDDVTLRRCARILVASKEQINLDEQGDLFDPLNEGLLRWDQIHELGDVAAGKVDFRTRPGEITLYKNNAGQGIADVAVGMAVLRKAQALSRGVNVDV